MASSDPPADPLDFWCRCVLWTLLSMQIAMLAGQSSNPCCAICIHHATASSKTQLPTLSWFTPQPAFRPPPSLIIYHLPSNGNCKSVTITKAVELPSMESSVPEFDDVRSY